MDIGATVVNPDRYRAPRIGIIDQQSRPEGQGRVCSGDPVSVKALSVGGGASMKTITVAVKGGHGALPVDCLSWSKRREYQRSNTEQTDCFKQ